ncbi:ArnT family glycosyltransferase [Candidatus Omnitrophota bacterium]
MNDETKFNHRAICVSSKGKEIIAIFILVLIVALVGIVNYRVLEQDTTIFMHDEFDYYDIAYRFSEAFEWMRDGDHRGLAQLKALWNDRSYRPRFFTLVVGVVLYLHGTATMDSMVMANIVFMLVLVFAMYLIGRKMSGISCGLLAAFVLLMFPGVFAFSRVSMPEFSLITLVALSYMLILYGESFTKTRYSILLGITIGCGMITKITYPAFVIMPLLLVFIKAMLLYCNNAKQRIVIVGNLFLVIILTLAIALQWYISHFTQLTEWMPIQVFLDESGSDAKGFYMLAFVLRQLYPFFYVVFIAMTVVLMLRGRVNFIVTMFANIIVPVLIICIASAEESRFTVPMLPFAALLIARGLVELKSKLITVMVVVIALFQFISLSFSEDSIFRVVNSPIFDGINNEINNRSRDNGLLHATQEDWSLQEKIYHLLKNNFDREKEGICQIYFIDNLEKIFFGVRYCMYRNDTKDYIFRRFSEGGTGWDGGYIESARYKEGLLRANFIVINDSKKYDSFKDYDGNNLLTLEYERWQATRKIFLEAKSRYILSGEFNLADDVIQIYKKK